MAMTTLYFMRHGYVDNPRNLFYGTEFPLSPRGREQIRDLAHDMAQAGVKPQFIRASPFLRTQQTANIAAEILRIPRIETDDRLREWDVGSWFDRPIVEFYEATGYDADPPPKHLPSGIESLERLGRRMVEALQDVLAVCPEGEALIVSHREPLVTALLTLQQQGYNSIHRVRFNRGTAWKVDFDSSGNFLQAAPAFDRSVDNW